MGVAALNVRISDLELGVFSPRLSVDDGYVEELAEDLKVNGQLKPIIVRPHPEKANVYQVIDGEYRVRAALKLGWSMVRAEVRAVNDEEALILAMRVNQLHGKRLDPLEEAKRLFDLKRLGYTEAKLAEVFLKSQQWVSDRLKLVKDASPELQRAVTARVVKPTAAREIAKLPLEVQAKVVEKVAKEGLSQRKVKAIVEAIRDKPEAADEVLAKPVEAFMAIAKPEAVKEALQMPMEAPVIEFFKCPCGCGYRLRVDWLDRKAEWLQP